MKRLIISPAAAFCAALGCLSQFGIAQAGPAECRSSGGPTVCVQFDNLPNAPEEDADYNFVFPDPPANPNVILRRGRALDGTLYNWRVWSLDTATDDGDGVGDIGTISSPGDYDYDVKLAANGSADHLMLFRGPFVDPIVNPQDWTDYEAAFGDLRDAGFTHMGLQIFSPTNLVVAPRVAALRAVGLPLALFASPGHEKLKKKCIACPPVCAGCPEDCGTCPTACQECVEYHANGLHAKYFDTVWLDEAEGELFNPNCYPNYSNDCDNDPHTVSHDPKYAGTLWDQELDYLGAQVDAANLEPGDVIILDFEVFRSPSAANEWYYPNVIANSTGRYTGTTLEDKYNEYRQAWDARAQELVDKCHEFAPSGVPVYFYGREIGEEGWVREGAAPNAEPGPLTLMPIMYYGSPLSAYECHLNHADYSGAVPFIHFSFSRCPESYCCGIVEGCPCPQNPFEDPPPLEEGTVASCPTWETSITQQIGALLRNEGVNGVVVYTAPNADCAEDPDYLNHAKVLASEMTRTTGARHVTGMTLVPTDSSKYSNIAAAEISGDLGGLVLQESSGEEGGAASVTIGGDLNGIVNIPTVNTLQVKGAVSAGSTITLASINGNVTVTGDITGALTVTGDHNGELCAGNLSPGQPLPQNIQIARFGPNATICGEYVCHLGADPIDKSRFISFVAPTSTNEFAIRVSLDSLHHVEPPYTHGPSIPFTSVEGQVRWVGPPVQYIESTATGTPFYASHLQCGAHYRDWSTVGLLHVTGSAIVPSSEYAVELVSAVGIVCSGGLTIRTTRWGDIETPYNPPSTTTQPDVTDIGAIVDKFRDRPGAPIKARALLDSIGPFGTIAIAPDVDFNSVARCVAAFKGWHYPYEVASCE